MTKFSVLNPMIPLDSEFRIRKALACSPTAAFIIAAVHGLGAILLLVKDAAPTIVSPHVAAALAGCGLGVLTRWRPEKWGAILILAWAIVEAPFTSPSFLPIRILTVLLAYQGLRGVLVKQKVRSSVEVF